MMSVYDTGLDTLTSELGHALLDNPKGDSSDLLKIKSEPPLVHFVSFLSQRLYMQRLSRCCDAWGCLLKASMLTAKSHLDSPNM